MIEIWILKMDKFQPEIIKAISYFRLTLNLLLYASLVFSRGKNSLTNLDLIWIQTDYGK